MASANIKENAPAITVEIGGQKNTRDQFQPNSISRAQQAGDMQPIAISAAMTDRWYYS